MFETKDTGKTKDIKKVSVIEKQGDCNNKGSETNAINKNLVVYSEEYLKNNEKKDFRYENRTRHLPRDFKMPSQGQSFFPRMNQQLGTAEQRSAGQVRARGEKGKGKIETKSLEVPEGHSGARDHWKEHGNEFPEYRNSREYVKGAIDFCRDPDTHRFYYKNLGKRTIGYYNSKTNTFAATSVDGKTIYTYFRPENVEKYTKNIRRRGVKSGEIPRHSTPLRKD